jgi:hypothetical protein
VVINNGGTLGGTGTVSGTVNLNARGTISAGDGIGTLTTGSETWIGGGFDRWEVSSATSSSGRDLLNISGALNLAATPDNPFIVTLVSMASPTTPGLVPDFNSNSNYTWVVATASGGLLNFDTGKAVVDASEFGNAFAGNFSLAVQGNSLVVNYTAPASPPAVALTSPANNQHFVATANIPLTASVTNNGHAISQVAYYNGAALVGASSAGPNYSATWSGVGSGSYSLTAVAVYDGSLMVTSAPPVNITVLGTPVLSGYGPLSGSSFPLTFSGPVGQTYQVLRSTNVVQPLSGWTRLTSGTFGASPVTYTDSNATNATQFYRIQSP